MFTALQNYPVSPFMLAGRQLYGMNRYVLLRMSAHGSQLWGNDNA